MGVDAPATVGTLLRDVDTPALLVDLDVFESNLKRMATDVSTLSIDLRPHAKTHKSAAIAQWQLEGGAIGITVAKVGEAEIFAEHGVSDIRIAYPLPPSTASCGAAANYLPHLSRGGEKPA